MKKVRERRSRRCQVKRRGRVSVPDLEMHVESIIIYRVAAQLRVSENPRKATREAKLDDV